MMPPLYGLTVLYARILISSDDIYVCVTLASFVCATSQGFRLTGAMDLLGVSSLILSGITLLFGIRWAWPVSMRCLISANVRTGSSACFVVGLCVLRYSSTVNSEPVFFRKKKIFASSKSRSFCDSLGSGEIPILLRNCFGKG